MQYAYDVIILNGTSDIALKWSVQSDFLLITYGY